MSACIANLRRIPADILGTQDREGRKRNTITLHAQRLFGMFTPARTWHEITEFYVLWRTPTLKTGTNIFPYFKLGYFSSGELSYIWQIERVGISALKFQWTRSPFFRELFAAVSVVWRGILNSLLSPTISVSSVPNTVNKDLLSFSPPY